MHCVHLGILYSISLLTRHANCFYSLSSPLSTTMHNTSRKMRAVLGQEVLNPRLLQYLVNWRGKYPLKSEMLLHWEPWVRQAVHVIDVGLDLIIRYIYYYLSVPPSCDLNGLKGSFTPDEFADLNGTHCNDSTLFPVTEHISNLTGNGMESFGTYSLWWTWCKPWNS